MKFTTSFVLAALPFLTLSMPAPSKLAARRPAEYVFGLTAISSGNEAIQYQPIVAQAGGLFIDPGITTPTVFDIDGSKLRLDSQAPVHPDVSLNEKSGLLVWTANDSVAAGTTSTGFSLTKAAKGEVVRNLLFSGKQDWLACPVAHAPGTYRILYEPGSGTVGSPYGPLSDCVGIALAAAEYKGKLPATYN